MTINLTSEEKASQLGVQRRRVNALCIAGRLPGAYKAKGKWHIPEDSFPDIRLKGPRPRYDDGPAHVEAMKVRLGEYVDRYLTLRQIALELDVHHSTASTWLKRFGLKTKKPTTFCRVCGKELKDSRRRRCGSCNTKVRRVRAKLAAVSYLGGRCQRCDYRESVAALEFHHRGKDKAFKVASVSNRSWEIIRRELDKCDLLCANCHRIEHSNREDERLLAEVENYRGDLLSMN